MKNSLNQVLNEELILLDENAETKEEVIDRIIDLLYSKGKILSKEKFKQAVYEREAAGKTGLGDGIAIPHGKSGAAIGASAVILRTKGLIQWESLDGEPVNLIILFAVNDDEKAALVKFLAVMARALCNTDVVKTLKSSFSPVEIIKAFEDFSSNL